MLFDSLWPEKMSFIPKYTGLETQANQETPEEISSWLNSTEYTSDWNRISEALYEAELNTSKDQVLFYSAFHEDSRKLIAALAHGGLPSQCALFFTSALRCSIYADHLLPGVKLSPMEFTTVTMKETLADLSQAGITNFAVDRCPYCWKFALTPTASIQTDFDVMNHWSKVKAAEIALANRYLLLANQYAEVGDSDRSKQLILHALIHVAPDDRRFHEHLRVLAETTKDKTLRDQANSALKHLHVPPGIAALLKAAGC